MKKLTLLTLFCTLATGVIAAPNDGWNEAMTVFKAKSIDGKNGFRIPAITSVGNGKLLAVADIRYAGLSGNTDMPRKVEFLVKYSNDGGTTWETTNIIAPEGGITDPAIVYNPDTNTPFIFGYNNNKGITTPGGNADFIVYKPNEDKTGWVGESIYDDIKSQIPNYDYFLQGPGSGLYYNGTMYMAIQAWKGSTATSGFVYSNDNGKSWNAVTLDGVLPDGISTSESNIFVHKGEIYLAAKNESHDPKNPNSDTPARIVYKTGDNGKSWEKVKEDFLPENIAKCETSSLTLSDDVYLVGYSLQGTQPWDRIDTYITTNTGRKIKIHDGPTYGYTSMTQDLDNLYVLFETADGTADIQMRRFDISAKEYANVNAQILNRANSILDIQDKLFASRSYLTGQYGSQDRSEVEAVVLNGNYKIGAFHKNTKKNSEDVYRTIEYKTEDTTLVLSQDNLFTNNDNIFIGYQYTKLEYINGSKNDVNSFVMGYSGRYNFKDVYNYHFALNGIYSNNKLKRNDAEGLGKSASFDSYSISMKNEINRDIDLYESAKFNVGLGLKTTYFGHDDIKEKNGNGFNDAFVDKSNNFSNEIYIKARVDKDVRLNEKFGLNFGTELKYKKELMNVDEWKDKFTVLDVEKEYSRPLSKHDGGVVEAKISASLDIADKVETSISYSIDSTGEGVTKGAITYKF